jgi:thiosulfate/3-mercaptopyruvate sulfurtransferase
MKDYAYPEVLVSTQWVEEHLNDTDIRIVESNEDILLYKKGHIPGAVQIDWQADLQDQVTRDYIGKEEFEQLMSKMGIGNETKVVFYGDESNWWACYAFWAFKLYGHEHCVIMDGGRQKWEAENRSMTKDAPQHPPASYEAKERNMSIRAYRAEVLYHSKSGKPMVDVRSPEEYSGELLHMADYPQEGAMRAGHIPGAVNVPWDMAVNKDGTFKAREELEKIYIEEQKLDSKRTTIAYCRIGERSSHTWFVLAYLLGFPDVKNYDGSWVEWGNLVGVPIDRNF